MAARLPGVAFEAAGAALDAGRRSSSRCRGPGTCLGCHCGACRESARCRYCAGPLGLRGARGGNGDAVSLPHCRWCGRTASFRCPACGSARLRAGVVGARRTAEELGRAFPGVRVRSSGGGAPVVAAVRGRPELVVGTRGAEPRAEGGYGAALLLDGWALLSRPDLRVAEETLRRWLAAAALVVPQHGPAGASWWWPKRRCRPCRRSSAGTRPARRR